jgi:hypothetical protein
MNSYRWMYPAGDRSLNTGAEMPYAGALVTIVKRNTDGTCVVRCGSREFVASIIRLEYTG